MMILYVLQLDNAVLYKMYENQHVPHNPEAHEVHDHQIAGPQEVHQVAGPHEVHQEDHQVDGPEDDLAWVDDVLLDDPRAFV